jgi:hypothetical protein
MVKSAKQSYRYTLRDPAWAEYLGYDSEPLQAAG